MPRNFSRVKHRKPTVEPVQPPRLRKSGQAGGYGYVSVTLSHPKRKFTERLPKEPKVACLNFGYTKQKYFKRFSKNPIMPGRELMERKGETHQNGNAQTQTRKKGKEICSNKFQSLPRT
jgi:hypothetical protein